MLSYFLIFKFILEIEVLDIFFLYFILHYSTWLWQVVVNLRFFNYFFLWIQKQGL